MSLFQPSNITPSAWAGEGQNVVAAEDKVSFSWQVNGTSPLTSFTIIIYKNTGNAAVDAQVVATLVGSVDPVAYPNGFYPTDRFGNTQFYTYDLQVPWAGIGLIPGMSYKYKINQNSNGAILEQSFFCSFDVIERPIITMTEEVNSARITLSGIQENASGEIGSVHWMIKENGTGTIISDTGEVYTSQILYVFDGAVSGKEYSYMLTIKFTSGYIMSIGWTNISTTYEMIKDSPANAVCVDGGVRIDLSSNIVDIPGEGEKYSIEHKKLFLYENDSSAQWDNIDITGENVEIRYKGEIENIVYLKEKSYLFKPIGDTGDYSGNKYMRISKDGKYLISIEKRRLGNFIYRSPYLYVNEDGNWILIKEILLDGASYMYASSCCFSPTDSSYFIIGSSRGNGEPLTVFHITSTSGAYNVTQVQTPKRNGQNVFACISVDFDRNGKFFGVCTSVAQGGACMFSFLSGTATYVQDFLNQSDAFTATPRLIKFDPLNNEVVIFGWFAYRVCLYTYNGLFGDPTWVSYLNTDLSGATRQDTITDIAYSPDGTKLVFSGWATGDQYPLNVFCYQRVNDGWSYSGYQQIDPVSGFNVYAICFSPDSKYLMLSGGGFHERNSNVCLLHTESYPFSVIGKILSSEGARFVSNQYDSHKGAFLILSNESDKPSGGWFAISTQDQKFLLITNNGVEVLTFEKKDLSLILRCPQAVISAVISSNEVEIVYNSEYIEINGNRTGISRGAFDVDNVELNGIQKCKYVFIGDVENNYKTWQSGTKFLALFYDPQLNAGTYNDYGTYSNAVYAHKETEERAIIELPTNFDSVIDYGEKSGEQLSYDVFFKTAEGAYGSYQSTIIDPDDPNYICVRLSAFYLFLATRDQSNNSVFHVQKVWKFSNNIDGGTVTNNNNPNWLTNFTKYRLRQPSKRIGKSGTLSGLIGNALNGVYADTAAQLKDLMQASEGNNTFFLKDPKGNIYMIGISAPIQGTVAWGTSKLQTTISIPWEEIGNADEVSLIATPNDGGWVDTSNPTQNTITENNASEEEPQTNNEEEPFDPNVVSA